MNTTPSTWTCPVCDEALEKQAERCFRCGNILADWWPLENTIQELKDVDERDTTAFVIPGAKTQVSWPWVAAIFALGILIGQVGPLATLLWEGKGKPPQRSIETGARPPVAPAGAQAPTVLRNPIIRYRVQKGDSLWRIAASVTGEGGNWENIWPELKGATATLQRGTWIDLDTSRIEAAKSRNKK